MDDEANTFVNNYRTSLKEQYDAANTQAAEQRKTDYGVIMANANKAGSMYSNFPQRSKIQYDTNTYLPTLQSNYTSYRTGLDTLRSNVADYQNQIKSLEEAIADINNDTIISSSYY